MPWSAVPDGASSFVRDDLAGGLCQSNKERTKSAQKKTNEQNEQTLSVAEGADAVRDGDLL